MTGASGQLGRRVVDLLLEEQHVPAAADDLRAGLAAAGLPAPLVELTVTMDINTQMGRVSSVSNALAELTGRPGRPVAEFLAAHAAALTAV